MRTLLLICAAPWLVVANVIVVILFKDNIWQITYPNLPLVGFFLFVVSMFVLRCFTFFRLYLIKRMVGLNG